MTIYFHDYTFNSMEPFVEIESKQLSLLIVRFINKTEESPMPTRK